MASDGQWESLGDTRSDVTTYRMAVPGGWLYRCILGQVGIAMAFVPDDTASELTTLSEPARSDELAWRQR